LRSNPALEENRYQEEFPSSFYKKDPHRPHLHYNRDQYVDMHHPHQTRHSHSRSSYSHSGYSTPYSSSHSVLRDRHHPHRHAEYYDMIETEEYYARHGHGHRHPRRYSRQQYHGARRHHPVPAHHQAALDMTSSSRSVKSSSNSREKVPRAGSSRIRIHGDSWVDACEGGFVGLIGKSGTKIGIYQVTKIDPLLPQNSRGENVASDISVSNFNTYHAVAFSRLFGVDMVNIGDFRQTVGERLIGFTVKPDGDVLVQTIKFTANAAVNIVKILQVFEEMRVHGNRSRSIEDLTTEGNVQAIVEQWMKGNKIIEMS